MRTRVCVLALVVACAAPRPRPPSGAVVLTVDGKVENAPFPFGREDLPKLPRGSFEAAAPFAKEHARARFEGVSLATLLSDQMEVMREADVAVIHGADGIAVPVPLPLLRQLRPVLADTVDGKAVGEWRKGAAPLQLAWPNLDHPGLDTDPRIPWWWVGGVSKVVLQGWNATYGKALRVPPGAGDAARIGADVLAAQCIGCHRVRGVGGTRGPALTGTGTQRGPAPAKLRAHLREVSGGRDLPEVSAEDARRVAAFIEAVAVAGKDDEDLAQPPPSPRDGDHPAMRPAGVRP